MAEYGDARLGLRFWSKVAVSDDGCWLWTAHRDRGGYGRYRHVRPQPESAHRVAYAAMIGPIEPGHDVHHECANRACVNPAHLRAIGHGEHSTEHDVLGSSNRAKEVCPQGHSLKDPANVRVSNGARRCRTCQAMQSREYMSRKRGHAC